MANRSNSGLSQGLVPSLVPGLTQFEIRQNGLTDPLISPEQRENIQTLIIDLQNSIDSAPSEESLIQWQTTFQSAIDDGAITGEEWQMLALDTWDIFESMGLANSELRTLAYDLQDIAEASHLPQTDDELMGTTGNDVLWGKTGADVLTGTSAVGQGEVDVLLGGGGADRFVLGDELTAYYDDGLAKTAGLKDYALIVDFNSGQDTIQLHGSAHDYSLGALPAGMDMMGTAIYLNSNAYGAVPELVGVIQGVSVADLSTGFVFL